MGMCRNNLLALIFGLFGLWSFLIFLNYSSLIISVRSLANFYIYSVNQQESIPFETTFSLDDDNFTQINSTTIRSNDETTNNDTSSFEQNEASTINNDSSNDDKHLDEVQKDNVDDYLKVLEGTEVDEISLLPPPPPPSQPPKKRPLPLPLPSRKKDKPRAGGRGKGRSRGRGRGKPTPTNRRLPERNPVVVISNPPPSPPPPSPSPPPPPPPPPPQPKPNCSVEVKSDPKSCEGRYIYVHTLPRRYNVDLLRDCSSLDLWMDMCQYVKNSGMGLPLPDSHNKVFSEHSWYATNQFLLEVIFHNRMKLYDCLTNDSSQAQAVFVPVYTGLDVARNLWNPDSSVRDSAFFELVKWLKRKPVWRRFWGRDHFFIGGRITWDFRRSENRKDPDWGTKFLYLPEARNMTALVIEASPWNNNDFGIPYPTYFHPSSDEQVFQWQNRMRKQGRKYLFSFAGAPRPDRPDSIRNQLIDQCKRSSRCNMVECNNWRNKCHKPAELMKVFQGSHFCLQPPGDSYTRRSTFDSILAGCIPVFFHPGSAYIQYLWHLPKDFGKYSVFISMYDVRDGKVSIEKTLQKITAKRVKEMREEVVRLIPKIVYSDPRCRMETIEDAFDLAVKGVLERVGRIKGEMREGRNDSFGYDERMAWKYEWLGRENMLDNKWDPYFYGTLDMPIR